MEPPKPAPKPAPWPLLLWGLAGVAVSAVGAWNFVGPALARNAIGPAFLGYVPSLGVHLLAAAAVLSLRSGYRLPRICPALVLFAAVVGALAAIGAQMRGGSFLTGAAAVVFVVAGPLLAAGLSGARPARPVAVTG
jgi:hypothetical protein